ncbi:MAG: NAD(P)-binding protein [Lachnospiraceae bacterium]|nr:NAD(P)-binding protein [Lachnospiraceae bacterium]
MNSQSVKYLILGGGPSGLSLAAALLRAGIEDFLVLEKESSAGGLCKSEEVDGSPFDTGGGHFLDVRNPKVTDFLFSYMPRSEWDEYHRDSRIDVKGTIINSPIEANIWQFDIDTQIEYLKSITKAGCNMGDPMPERFTDWIYWKLGKRIADDYMIPYNKKMFAEDLDSLGTYWLNKLPDVSFEETLRSCLERRAYGKQPGHAVFLYPKKYGIGELWRRVADSLGDRLLLNTGVEKLDFKTRTVNDTFSGEILINTAPWTDFQSISGLDEAEMDAIHSLRHSSIVTEYHPEMLDTKSHWVYYPDPVLSYHRILVRHNFCPGSRGYWTETNLTRYEKNPDAPAFLNEYAYPMNTIGKQEKMAFLLSSLEKYGVYGLGRWGEWQHFNSDVVVERAMALAEKLASS